MLTIHKTAEVDNELMNRKFMLKQREWYIDECMQYASIQQYVFNEYITMILMMMMVIIEGILGRFAESGILFSSYLFFFPNLNCGIPLLIFFVWCGLYLIDLWSKWSGYTEFQCHSGVASFVSHNRHEALRSILTTYILHITSS